MIRALETERSRVLAPAYLAGLAGLPARQRGPALASLHSTLMHGLRHAVGSVPAAEREAALRDGHVDVDQLVATVRTRLAGISLARAAVAEVME